MTNINAVNNEIKEIIFNNNINKIKTSIEKKANRIKYFEVIAPPVMIILIGVLILSFTV